LFAESVFFVNLFTVGLFDLRRFSSPLFQVNLLLFISQAQLSALLVIVFYQTRKSTFNKTFGFSGGYKEETD